MNEVKHGNYEKLIDYKSNHNSVKIAFAHMWAQPLQN